ncbi:MAG: 1-(5-phosphoribosyl)-5-[(5-phosphoribosylamino)methylideneamino]imidazole-4-carboxamide isomerase [Cellvibrionales bacterium]|jgi:phosphoribosylformimino-5-aminoimidazole carboxamide ribotide isomerase
MLIIPAIDLKDGQCVRLRKGLMEDSTVFSDDPAGMARTWRDQGARRLHLVDLNGAFAGTPVNDAAVEGIIAETEGLPVQIGGGIRDLATIERYLNLGVDSVIIGTAALKDPALVRVACREYPGRVMVGVDARNGRVATDGWAETSDLQATELAQRFEQAGVSAIIYTDIDRDGMMQGVNIEATLAMTQASSIPIIASGGVSHLDDIRMLAQHARAGIAGAITGRAIYEGTLDLAEAQATVDALLRPD